MSSFTKVILRQVGAFSREALAISRHLYQTRPSSITETRQLIHKLAISTAPENTLSLAMLQIDKEIVHMQYHGIFNYITKKINFSVGTGLKDQTSKRNLITKNENEKKKAKIAFMITRQQKLILSSSLGYPQDEIKRLKPLEAMIIIEHSIEHDAVDWRSRVATLVKENELILEKQMQKAEEDIRLKEERSKRDTQISELGMGFSELPIPTQQVEQRSADEDTGQVKQLALGSSSDKDETLQAITLKSNTNNSNDEKHMSGWFAVQQHFPNDNNAQTIALYKTEKEALQCVDIKKALLYRQSSKKSNVNVKVYSIKKI